MIEESIVWVDGALTVEMVPITHRTALVRYHTDPAKIPGDVEWTCAVVVGGDGRCEINIFSGRAMLPSERRRLCKHIKSLGVKVGKYCRHKNGEEPREVIIK